MCNNPCPPCPVPPKDSPFEILMGWVVMAAIAYGVYQFLN